MIRCLPLLALFLVMLHDCLFFTEDIALYGSGRFRVARQMAELVADLLLGMSSECRQCFLELLSQARLTAVFEALFSDHQHVEDLSHLDR